MAEYVVLRDETSRREKGLREVPPRPVLTHAIRTQRDEQRGPRSELIVEKRGNRPNRVWTVASTLRVR